MGRYIVFIRNAVWIKYKTNLFLILVNNIGNLVSSGPAVSVACPHFLFSLSESALYCLIVLLNVGCRTFTNGFTGSMGVDSEN